MRMDNERETVVNGKEIQISITGFMEKNTGKFMKELWTLLLSAQNNSSGVPQQFLDAREAEAKSKEAAAKKRQDEAIEKADQLASELGKKREREHKNRRPEDEKRADEKNGVKEMIYEDPVTGADFEKQTLTTTTGKKLKYGSLIIATGCTASRFRLNV
ncbi:unnamed protein product [Microthlaspi erraticum]|uniref:PWI domain-containing protein n=1 Tax=Microthlaspi erraticum TaxID=1685480 RepID=A0A6D2IT71_9BRAS|nr:unnamed protein product [Microthlaspi erraticum]